MLVHPAFVVDPSYLSTEEVKWRLSNNCASVTSIDFRPRSSFFHRGLVKALSRNNRVREVHLDLLFFGGDPETIRALVDWLVVVRGNMCCLTLSLEFWKSADVRLGERMVAFLSQPPSQARLNIKEVKIRGFRVVPDVLSLLSKNTSLEIRDEEASTSLLPHFHRVAELKSLRFHLATRHSDPFLSCQTIQRVNISIEDWQALDAVVDGLIMHHSQDGTTRLNEVCLRLRSGVRGGRLPEALSRIPQRLSVDVVLCGSHAEDLVEEMQFVPGLRSIELAAIGMEPFFVSGLEELCHGRIEELKLRVNKLETPIRLMPFHSSDLLTLHFILGNLDQSDESVEIELAKGFAEVVPTMSRLKDLVVENYSLFHHRVRRIRNKQEHDEYMASRNRDSRYVAYDALVEAVCQSPSITKCVISTPSEWHRSRICFSLKTRLIRVNTLLSTTTESTPLSLLPLALSTLSVGRWYDVMAYIVRQKSDQLIR